MIFVRITGGLGNQLFQYAAARALSIRNNEQLKLDISYYNWVQNRTYCLNSYNISGSVASEVQTRTLKYINKIMTGPKYITDPISQLLNYEYYKDSPFDIRNHIFTSAKRAYLDGYWSDECYFHDFQEIIINDLTIKSKAHTKYDDLLKQIKQCESVSIHIRRTDYLSSFNNQLFNYLDDSYYLAAVKVIKMLVKNPRYFIFSDDIANVKKNMRCFHDLDVMYVEPIQDINEIDEFEIMRSCKHNIIANSTYSWWAAWLNINPHKIVICPKIWYISQRYQQAYGKTLLRTNQKWLRV